MMSDYYRQHVLSTYNGTIRKIAFGYYNNHKKYFITLNQSEDLCFLLSSRGSVMIMMMPSVMLVTSITILLLVLSVHKADSCLCTILQNIKVNKDEDC